MKFILIFSLLIVFTFSVPNVFSYTIQKARLYNLLRRPLETKPNSLILPVRHDDGVSDQQPNFDEDEDNKQARNSWDSGEDYYFQWANQNRRPVENLTGRKREVERSASSARDRRINGGLWRSGLVG